PAVVHLESVNVSGYRGNGVSAKGLPATGGHGLAMPRLTFDGVTLTPAGDHATGVRLQGSVAQIHGSRIEGNDIGVMAVDHSVLAMDGTAVLRSRTMGVFALYAGLDGDVLQGNDFGNRTAGTGNGVAVEARMRVTASVLDSDGQALAGPRLLLFAQDRSVPFVAVAAGANRTATAEFLAYGLAADGSSTFSGPFRYRLEHPALAAPLEGVLDMAQPVILGHAAPAKGLEPSPAQGIDYLALGLGAVVALAGAVAALRWWSRTETRP
ncbi:MAG: hypothetical protein LC620_02980, partial [Halobacteriales archaeon]|nr:hypothetical protein [Halobacteriales archaeon]